MAEVFTEFGNVVVSDGKHSYIPRACGGPMTQGIWQGWIEYVSTDDGQVVRTPRETTQPNRTDIAYWATGLTPVYLEGALSRALHPRVEVRETLPAPAFDGPAPSAITVSVPSATAQTESVLNPFSVYRKGERLLRGQLAAMSAWHLVNIIQAYRLSAASPEVLNRMAGPTLIDLIVAAVRSQNAEPIVE